jgi:hypothetical protein
VGKRSTPRRDRHVDQAGLCEVPHVMEYDRREHAARLLKPVGAKETEYKGAKHLSQQTPDGFLSEVHKMPERKDQCYNNAGPAYSEIQKANLTRHRRRQIAEEQRSVGNLLSRPHDNSLKTEPADNGLRRQRIVKHGSAARN